MTLLETALMEQEEIRSFEEEALGLLALVAFGGKHEDDKFIKRRIAYLRSSRYGPVLDRLSEFATASSPASRFYFIICDLDSLLSLSGEIKKSSGTSPRQARAEEMYY